MPTLRRASTIGAVTLSALLTVTTAQAAQGADVRVLIPYKSKGKIVAEARVYPPSVAAKWCVSLIINHPYSGGLVMKSTCKTMRSGTLKASIDNWCGAYKTHIEASRNGKHIYYKDSSPQVICG